MRSPVFRHAGSWRHAGTTKQPPKSHPGGGGRPSSHHTTMRYTTDTQNDTHRAIAAAQPRTTSGVRLEWSDLARPACRHDPAWRNTGFRTAPTASRGWRNVHLWSSSPPVAEGWALRCAISGRALHHRKATKVACLIITTLHLRSCAGVGEVPPKTACQRYAPSPTIHIAHTSLHP